MLDAVLDGSISTDSIGTKDKTIASSALVMPEFVSLPRNRSQVVVLSKYEQNNTVYVELESRNVSLAMAMDGAQYENIRVEPIDQVLSIPPLSPLRSLATLALRSSASFCRVPILWSLLMLRWSPCLLP